jgi:hypothetical protein
MDYYEELGLKPTATVQEIRQAYKVLARLVHPDGQANQPVREMAERQMKRLNQIMATLTDEQARREYDTGLETASRHPPAAVAVSGPHWRWMDARMDARMARLPRWFRPVAQNWFWFSMALMVVGVGIWYLAQVRAENTVPAAKAALEGKKPAVVVRRIPAREAKPVRRMSDAGTAKPSHAPRHDRTAELNPPRPPESIQNAREASTAEVPMAAKPLETLAQKTMPVPAAAPAPVSPPEIGNSPAGAPAAKLRGSPFAGNWLYVPDPNENGRPGLYPAKYVELLMGEEHGRLRGTYRAEFQILDRAVSPEVTFELEGDTPSGISAHLRWTATDGAKGDVDLALAGPNILKITWWTTEFGRHSKLASGTSKLIRQQAP